MFKKQRKAIQKALLVTKSKFVELGQSASKEGRETAVAAKILRRLMKEEQVSEAEIAFLKAQSLDLGKIVALIGVQAIPGSSVAVLALEKVAQKYGLSLFPRNQDIPPDSNDSTEKILHQSKPPLPPHQEK